MKATAGKEAAEKAKAEVAEQVAAVKAAKAEKAAAAEKAAEAMKICLAEVKAAAKKVKAAARKVDAAMEAGRKEEFQDAIAAWTATKAVEASAKEAVHRCREQQQSEE